MTDRRLGENNMSPDPEGGDIIIEIMQLNWLENRNVGHYY